MQIVSLDNRWNHLVSDGWIARLDNTLFLTRCRNGTITKLELHTFVRQQFFYSRHFTRYLCALLTNVTNEADRLELSHNLFEEMGFGEFGSIPHSQIYRDMMSAMGIDPESEEVLESTRRLIDAMLSACMDSNPLVGLGALCLGAEAIVPHLYSQIMLGFEFQGEKPENLEFFKIHIEGDDEHAVTMRNIIERELQKNPSQLEVLYRAAGAIIEARAQFFEAITLPQPFLIPSPGVNYARV